MWEDVGGRCFPLCPFVLFGFCPMRMHYLLFNFKIKCKRKHSPWDFEGEPRKCHCSPQPCPPQWPASTCPSVDAEKNSVPVFDCSQMEPYTGSRWLNSMVDSSATKLPLRVSQQAGGRFRMRGRTEAQTPFPATGRGDGGMLLLLVWQECGFSESGLGPNLPEFLTNP